MKHSGTHYSVKCLFREFDPFVKDTCRVFDDTAWSMRNGGMQFTPKYIHQRLEKKWLSITAESMAPVDVKQVQNKKFRDK